MLLDIVANIVAAQPDMDIVEGVESETDLLKAVEFSDADVVILSRRTPVQGEFDGLLRSRSCLKVIEIEGEGRCGSLYELRPHRVPLGEMSPRRIARRDSHIGAALAVIGPWLSL
jgi:hypothetical protein